MAARISNIVIDNPSWVDEDGYVKKVREYRGGMTIRDDDQVLIVLYDSDGKPLMKPRLAGFLAPEKSHKIPE